MGLDEYPSMPFDRLYHPLPDRLRESSDDGVVMVNQPFGPLIMIANNKHRGPKLPQKPPPMIDIIKVIVCGIGVVIVGQSACSKRSKVIGVPQVNDLIGTKLITEKKRGSERILIGPIAVSATDSHYPLSCWNNGHAELQAFCRSSCKRYGNT